MQILHVATLAPGWTAELIPPPPRRIQIWGREVAASVLIPYSLVVFFHAKPSLMPSKPAPKENYRHHRENDQIMCNVEQWAKEQK